MSEKNSSKWDWWSRRKKYDRPHLELYYHIRRRNLKWLTELSLSHLSNKENPRILKTDLWNEAKKDEPFFVDADGMKIGIDISNSICGMAKSRFDKNIHMIQGSIEALPFASDSFDIIWDISTIDHFENPEKVIKEYAKALKPDGVLLLVAENPFCLSYPATKIQSLLNMHVPFIAFMPSRLLRACRKEKLKVIDHFKTNVHLPTFIVYPLERKDKLEKINQGRNFFWNFCKKYFVVIARKA